MSDDCGSLGSACHLVGCCSAGSSAPVSELTALGRLDRTGSLRRCRLLTGIAPAVQRSWFDTIDCSMQHCRSGSAARSFGSYTWLWLPPESHTAATCCSDSDWAFAGREWRRCSLPENWRCPKRRRHRRWPSWPLVSWTHPPRWRSWRSRTAGSRTRRRSSGPGTRSPTGMSSPAHWRRSRWKARPAVGRCSPAAGSGWTGCRRDRSSCRTGSRCCAPSYLYVRMLQVALHTVVPLTLPHSPLHFTSESP